jgi:hypothetical protein
MYAVFDGTFWSTFNEEFWKFFKSEEGEVFGYGENRFVRFTETGSPMLNLLYGNSIDLIIPYKKESIWVVASYTGIYTAVNTFDRQTGQWSNKDIEFDDVKQTIVTSRGDVWVVPRLVGNDQVLAMCNNSVSRTWHPIKLSDTFSGAIYSVFEPVSGETWITLKNKIVVLDTAENVLFQIKGIDPSNIMDVIRNENGDYFLSAPSGLYRIVFGDKNTAARLSWRDNSHLEKKAAFTISKNKIMVTGITGKFSNATLVGMNGRTRSLKNMHDAGSGKLEFSTSEIARGIYLIKISTTEGAWALKTIVP